MGEKLKDGNIPPFQWTSYDISDASIQMTDVRWCRIGDNRPLHPLFVNCGVAGVGYRR